VWALGSSGPIESFPVLSGIESLTILAERCPASAEAIEVCGRRWRAAGREVLVNRPIVGKDLNDSWRAPNE
jgi:putative DNA primase/helicase